MAAPAPIKTAGMEPIEVAELLKKKMMKAKLSRDQVNRLWPASLTGRDHAPGEGSIYAQALLHSTKKEAEDRKLNQEVYMPASLKAREDAPGEGNIYAQALLQSTKKEAEDRKRIQDVYTNGVARAVMGEVELLDYAKCLAEDHHADGTPALKKEVHAKQNVKFLEKYPSMTRLSNKEVTGI